ncbi:MAG: LamG domain-containing protein [Kiritimatiellae bacterium]|nr:LamG domain-containing protein [Kiritimatiellia bacterium]
MKKLSLAVLPIVCASRLCSADVQTPFAAWEDVENPAALTNGLAMPPAFTAMAWFEAGSFADFAPVLTYTTDFSACTNGFGVFAMSGGSLAAYVRSIDETALMAEGLKANEPYHVALVYTGAAATLYVNGEPKSTTNFAASASLDCGGALRAGAPPGAKASPPFDGVFAGVRLYSAALGRQAIASLYVSDRLAGLKASGRNVSSIDSDGDGMPDVWELQFRLNPLDSSDAASDSDGDGMSNLDEFRRSRSPRARPLAAAPSLLKSCTVVAP